jgi:flagellar basal-body rod modification protein FlgD
MTVQPTTSVANNATSTIAPSASSNKALTQNDFLKLLTVQMQNQDPMQPMDDQAFMGQMAQFSTLQATTTMSTNMTSLLSSSNLTTASALVGKKVTVQNTAVGTVVGDVTGVDASSGTPQVTINGKPYSLSDITNVVPDPTWSATGSVASTPPTS